MCRDRPAHDRLPGESADGVTPQEFTSEAVGCGGTPGETPAGPATPGRTAARPPFASALPPEDGPATSLSAARACEIRIASMVMS
ncbi:hypothetical protein SHKM778_10640 [Streptomyces sp. KM77-8]|uniref:Uncharacterized protein n=1 Tax=Streptomyces haneummycinicus TaxID=3074435 RepID=A0AAT9HBB3_9ACTN